MPDKTTLESKVPLRGAGSTLLDYLSTRFRYKTRKAWSDLIAAGSVTVNGKPGGPAARLSHGDKVAYSVVLNEPRVDTNVVVVHEEDAFAVAIKPGQLPSHADGNFITHTFIHIVQGLLKKGEVPARLVHRLDRETSGLMVVSRDKSAHANLVRQFAAGTVEKEYVAVAKGRIDRDRFEVSGPLAPDPASRVSVRHALVPEGTPGARDSRTGFVRIRDIKDATVLKCVPHTGRTNQIRVHLASIGHPVVGDKLYGRTDEEFLAFVRHVRAGGDAAYAGHAETPRHLLHASRLSFDHPATGLRVVFEAPLPADFEDFVRGHPFDSR